VTRCRLTLRRLVEPVIEDTSDPHGRKEGVQHEE
jgi:hypothetical protein